MCPFCGQLFMFREDQEKHVQHHKTAEYRCFLCGRRRKNEELLKTHMLSHFIYEKYGCNVCEKRFKKKKNMERHLKEVHFICQYCGKTCDNKIDLIRHNKIHDDLICLLCRKSFSQKNRLKYHYQLQHGHQDFYQCTLCFQRFSMKSRLLNHMKLIHKGIFNYDCSVCAAPFLYWQQYVNHFENAHRTDPPEKELFLCSSCDFSTNLKIKLQWHVEKTSGDGFFCKKCQVRFKCKGLFEKHMETHYGERVWICDHCDRSYSSDSTLKHHVSMYHKDELMKLNPRAYPCLESGCEAVYTNISSRARHIRRSHSKNATKYRPSNNKSNKKRKLSQYRESHEEKTVESTDDCLNKGYHHLIDKLPAESEVDVYSCDICKRYWFTGAALFRKHMNNHEETLWNEKCAVCDKTLESPEDAVSHYSEDHLNVKVEFLN